MILNKNNLFKGGIVYLLGILNLVKNDSWDSCILLLRAVIGE